MSLKIVVLAKQVPDTRCVGKDAMNADGTIRKGEGNDYHWFRSEYHYHPEDIMAKVANQPADTGEAAVE